MNDECGLMNRDGSVALTEVSRLLHLYCSAVAGKPLGVKSTTEAPPELVRAGHHLPLTDGKVVYLPDCVEKRDTSAENFSVYKVLAAHQAGYIEFGTFELDIDTLLDHPWVQALRKIGDTMPHHVPDFSQDLTPLQSHYELFFRVFDDRQLARDIFFAVEDGRVDFRLRERYRGLAAELTKVAFAEMKNRPQPASLPLREALVESLIRLSVTGHIEELLPHSVSPLYRRVCTVFARVLHPQATANDSAIAAAHIYLMLQALPNIRLQAPFCETVAEAFEHIHAERLYASAHLEAGIPESELRPCQPALPVAYRGQTMPEIVQLEKGIEILKDAVAVSEETGVPLTAEMLAELLRRGAKIKINQMTAKELAETSGLFITDLGGVLQEKLKELSPDERKKLAKLLERLSAAKGRIEDAGRVFFYDEWNYLAGDYRPHWCRLREVPLEGESSAIVTQIQKEHAPLIAAVRRQFQRIRPEMLRKVKRLRSGEEIELNDAIEAVVDRRAGLTPSERIYQKRDRRQRDVATAFLLDLSASTDEWIVEEPEHGRGRLRHGGTSRSSLIEHLSGAATPFGTIGAEELPSPGKAKRVIDVEREALVIMAEALESLRDMYAIYGFSGYGRENVEFFIIKDFSETYSERARRRIGAIKPQKSTRMGPAIRHALQKLGATNCRLKALILLSDGYPQDFDYGPDRTSRDYGLHDTAVALREARNRKVHTFCVTVDQAGNDYLHAMCGGENYLVVKKPSALPKILPRIYRGLTV